MGLDQDDKTKLDESGVLDEGELVDAKTIFGIQNLPSTSVAINEWFARHLIFRKNPSPKDLVDRVNQLNAKAEGLGVIEEFANTVRKERDAIGIKKG